MIAEAGHSLSASLSASLAGYSWALWLAVPVVATAVAAVLSWWRGRAPRSASPVRAARDHQRYLEALGRASAQAADRASPGAAETAAVPTSPESDSSA